MPNSWSHLNHNKIKLKKLLHKFIYIFFCLFNNKAAAEEEKKNKIPPNNILYFFLINVYVWFISRYIQNNNNNNNKSSCRVREEITTFIQHIPNQLALFPDCAFQFFFYMKYNFFSYIIRENQINFNWTCLCLSYFYFFLLSCDFYFIQVGQKMFTV